MLQDTQNTNNPVGNTPPPPRELKTETPTYSELLQAISDVQTGEYVEFDVAETLPGTVVEVDLELQPYDMNGRGNSNSAENVTFSQTGGGQAPPMANDASGASQPGGSHENGADAQHTPVDESFPSVNKKGADTAFSKPADDPILARQTTGSVPLPDYAAQGINDYPVPPDNALADNDTDPHHHHNPPYSPANLQEEKQESQQQNGAQQSGTSDAPQKMQASRQKGQGVQNAPKSGYPQGNDAPFYSAPEEGEGPGTPTVGQKAGMPNYDASPDDLTIQQY